MQPLQVFRTTGATLNSTQLAMTTCPGTTGNIVHLVYGFGSGTNDNGNVLNIANCRNTNRSQTFTYDTLNRIQTAYTTGSNWGESFGSATSPGGVPATPGIDAWGNLWQRSQITGKTTYEPLSVSATLQNHLTGFGYDAAGNMTSNGSATYTYDGENRLTQSAGWVYTYDGDGKRVKKCASACTTGTLYWTGAGSDTLSESDLSGNMQKEYIYFNGGRVARRDVSANSAHYFFTNHLGSTSVITSSNGSTLEEDLDHFPYGGVASGTPTDHYEFTGKERDAESGLDYFGARYNASNMGRFISADKPFADQHTANPQSWNLYVYARNNPEKDVDVNGFKVLEAVVAEAVGKMKAMQGHGTFYLDFAGIRGFHSHESITASSFDAWHSDHKASSAEVIPNKGLFSGLLRGLFGTANRDQTDTALAIIKQKPDGVNLAIDTYSNGVNSAGKVSGQVTSGTFASATVVAPNTSSVATLQAIDDADSGPFEIYQSINDPALALALFGSLDTQELVQAFPDNVTLTSQASHNLDNYQHHSDEEADRQCELGNPAACN